MGTLYFKFFSNLKATLKKIKTVKAKKKSAFSGVSSEASQIKMSCVRVFFPRTVRSNCDYSLEMGLLGKLKPSLPLPVTARLLIFRVQLLRCYFSRLLWNQGEGNWTRKVKTRQSSLLSQGFSRFSWINTPGLLQAFELFQSSEKGDLDNFFASVLIGFIEEWIFGGFCSMIPEVLFYQPHFPVTCPRDPQICIFSFICLTDINEAPQIISYHPVKF